MFEKFSSDDVTIGFIPEGNLKALPSISLQSGGNAPVALISLADMGVRREKLIQNGIPLDWVEGYFPAIDMRNVPLEEAQAHIEKDAFFDQYGFLLSPGQVGCALSHREAARYLLQSDSI